MKCRYCGRQIQFIRSVNQTSIPCNMVKLYYKPGGKERLVTPGGKVVACTLTSKYDKDCEGFGFTAHFATCQGREAGREDGQQIKMFE